MAALVVFIWADNAAVYLADKIIMNRDADFERRFDFDRLDWSRGRNLDCEFRRIFILYRYQTCFVSTLGEKVSAISETRYYYHRPIALTNPARIIISALSPSKLFFSLDYYFSEPAQGRVLRRIRYDGSIKEY
ncbi:hypothetical protein [Candidatus Halocynthiibacter alkanivorans]|uniref:hypothetical protein n=1 Tax=Candidatus Halocynthiibacter alkanivorans TaxID=2267619 RepID=UPI00109D1A4A|nr:hypothetical protein [Candidatus Halocynthiibacter alkanivorans]